MERSSVRRTAVALLIVLASACGNPATAGAPPLAPKQVSAWAFTNAWKTSLPVATSANALTEVGGDWWSSASDGRVDSWTPDGFVAAVHADGLPVLATVANGAFNPNISHAILSHPARRIAQIGALVTRCDDEGYDGVELDWESMDAGDRDAFSAFVADLATALHANGKILAIAVHPKLGEPGGWSGAKAQDWAALGAAVDEFKIMTYDEHGGWSKPGPISDPSWADRVLDFAETQVPSAKIWMGIPFYGYDWGAKGARSVTWKSAEALAERYHASILRDDSGEARFTYKKVGVRHTVFFQDAGSVTTKLDMMLTEHPDIAGVAVWSMGGEDPTFWSLIDSTLP